MCGSCHVQNVPIGVKYQNQRQTVDVYLLFAILLGQIYQKLDYRLVTYKEQKENKPPKFNNNVNIRSQLEHFKYDMNCTPDKYSLDF